MACLDLAETEPQAELYRTLADLYRNIEPGSEEQYRLVRRFHQDLERTFDV